MPNSASTKLKVDLNLLHPQGVPVGVPIKILKWLLSYGRFVAVAVEVFVIAMFLYRFQLDSQLASIQQKINQQVPFIESLNPDVALLKQTQSELSTISQVVNNSVDWQALFTQIAAQVPTGVSLTTVNVDHTQIAKTVSLKITGEANSSNDLAIFLNGMKQAGSFQNITLTTVGYDNGKLTFIINGGTK